MAKTTLPNIRITGCAVTMGEISQQIDDVPGYYNNDPALLARLKNIIGFGTRRIAAPTTTSADLCEQAARKLFDALHIAPSSLEAIISVTQTPDYIMPGNAHVLHKKLGLPETAAALDVELGCSGYVYGLWLASMMVASGLERVLLVAGDTLSRLINAKDRTLAPLFGDAGSATLIERDENAPPSHFILRADGSGLDTLVVPAGAARTPRSEATAQEIVNEDGSIRSMEDFFMDGFAVFEFTMTKQPPLLRDILEYSGASIENTDFFVLHQANKYIVETITKKAKIPAEKAPSSGFPLYGNQNAASIPGVLCGILREQLAGTTARVVMQGYGAGLSWGACHTTLDNIVCLPPDVYDPNLFQGNAPS